MAENFYTILTNIGKAKIANATALQTKLNITKFAVGDGNGHIMNLLKLRLPFFMKFGEAI